MVFNRTQDVASDAEWGQLVVIGIGTYRWLACSDCLVEFLLGWLVDWFLDWCGGCLLDLRRVLWLHGRLMTGRERKRERQRERQSDNKLNNPQEAKKPVLQGVHWIRRLNTDPGGPGKPFMAGHEFVVLELFRPWCKRCRWCYEALCTLGFAQEKSTKRRWEPSYTILFLYQLPCS